MTRRFLCGALLAVLAWAGGARADEPRPVHGSRTGAGSSRGPGGGDGRGRGSVEPHAGEDESLPSPIELAEEDALAFTPIAAYRLRYLHEEGRDFTSGGATNGLRHRARLGLEAHWHRRLGARIEVQDVRTFGEELDTTDASADGLDMHQAYASFTPFDELELRVGRQEIGLANERLVGVYDHLEQARSLDALRVHHDGPIDVDAFAALVRADDVGAGAELDEGDAGLAALLIRYEIVSALAASVVAVGERDERDGRRIGTAGVLGDGTIGDGLFRWQAEGYYQFGRADGDVRYSAFLVGARARVTVPASMRPFAELHADFASGDDDVGDNLRTSFAAPFGDAHAFFGAMDVFVDLPADTAEHGLRDLGATIGLRPLHDLELRVRHHLFQAMEPRGDLVHFGHELDVLADYRFWEHARASGAYGLFVPGSLIEAERGVPEGEIEHYAHLTLGVAF